MSRHLVVVGGGITGLAAAWEAGADPAVRVTVVEAADRFGGKIHTSPLGLGDGTTMAIDEGADAFLARVPDAVELCQELGLSDELTQPAIGRAKVLVDGELRHMPTDTVLGVPLDPDPLAASGVLSAAGLDAVRAEELCRMPAPDGDVAIGPYLAERFGRELVDRLVGPLVGGINAGDVDELSLRAVTPQLAEPATDGGSLTLALRRRGAAAPRTDPVFHALVGGSGRLVEALVEQLADRGVELLTGTAVARIERADGGYSVLLGRPAADPLADPAAGATTDAAAPGALEADALVLTTPAPVASRLLADLSPDASRELAGITHSSPVLVTLVYRREEVDAPLDASGFLVPRDAGLLVTAASFGSSKWAHWDDGRHVVLRVSAGHSHDDRPDRMTDDEIVAALRDDLRVTMGLTARPTTARVSRYPDGFAQYTVGHLDRVDRIDAALHRDAPGLLVAGAPYRGVGIPACIRQGRSAARALLGRLLA